MSKKNVDFYFNNFIETAAISCETAELLKDILENFNPNTLLEKKKLIHEIERKGDEKRHEMVRALAHAFITPIERNDLLKLSQNIDDVTDSIEDIIIHIYMNNVTTIRSDSIEFANIVIKCCDAMLEMMREFPNFKKSKKLKELIIKINHLEEHGDDMYIKCMRMLHTNPTGPFEIIAWREIYGFFEKCCDACENVADIVEGIAIGNT